MIGPMPAPPPGGAYRLTGWLYGPKGTVKQLQDLLGISNRSAFLILLEHGFHMGTERHWWLEHEDALRWLLNPNNLLSDKSL